jgi:signal transduction histidine kinase
MTATESAEPAGDPAGGAVPERVRDPGEPCGDRATDSVVASILDALDRLPIRLWAMDASGTCTLSVGGGLRVREWEPGELVGRNLRAEFANEPGIGAVMDRALAGEAFSTEGERDGVVFGSVIQPGFDEAGAVRMVYIGALDITEPIHRREQLRIDADRQRTQLLDMLSVQEIDRAQLAEVLHDDTIQVLSAVDLRIQLLRQRLADQAEPDDELVSLVDALGGALKQAQHRFRSVMSGLEPPRVTAGLAPALRELGAGILQGTSIAFEVVDRSTAPPTEPVSRVLYRIAQEALTNVVRHAAASAVVAEIVEEGGGWSLTVIDDGVGPGPEGFAERPGHRGLVGMRTRVLATGGTLSVHAFPRGGTEVRAWVPQRIGAIMNDNGPLDLREPLREILDEADEAFVALDRDWRYVFVNRRAAQIGEREARDLEGRNIWAEFPGMVGSNFYVQCHRAMAEQRPVEFSDFYLGHWLENRLVPTRHGLFAYYRDVTEQRRSWRMADHASDAGQLLLAALSETAAIEDPGDRVQRILDVLVGSRWFTGARVVGGDGTVIAQAGTAAEPPTADRSPTGATATGPGSSLLAEPLLGGADGRIELDAPLPAHLAVRWLARTLAAMLSPIVLARQRLRASGARSPRWTVRTPP